jgi:hypothetical protein
MNERITTVEDVLAVFAMGDQIALAGHSATPLLADAFDDLDRYHFGQGGHIWHAACVAYDRLHGAVCNEDNDD